MKKLSLHHKVIAAAGGVAVVGTLLFAHGWTLWLPVLTAWWVTERINKELRG